MCVSMYVVSGTPSLNEAGTPAAHVSGFGSGCEWRSGKREVKQPAPASLGETLFNGETPDPVQGASLAHTPS